MLLLNPQLIKIDDVKIREIDMSAASIFRNITFNRKKSSRKLLDSFIQSTNSLTELLSIKNAQMEAQNEEEVTIYLRNLNRTILFVVNEIKNNIPFETQVQLFQLLRLITPESHEQHPNKFRQTLVQIGNYICPDPKDIAGLVAMLFQNLQTIKHPIIRAIYFHHELIRIHPFVDGNGRVTRIAKNWMLMYALYPPIFIKDDQEKKEYITSLSKSFTMIDKNNSTWHDETAVFFEQELNRILRNISLILNNLNEVN